MRDWFGFCLRIWGGTVLGSMAVGFALMWSRNRVESWGNSRIAHRYKTLYSKIGPQQEAAWSLEERLWRNKAEKLESVGTSILVFGLGMLTLGFIAVILICVIALLIHGEWRFISKLLGFISGAWLISAAIVFAPAIAIGMIRLIVKYYDSVMPHKRNG